MFQCSIAALLEVAVLRLDIEESARKKIPKLLESLDQLERRRAGVSRKKKGCACCLFKYLTRNHLKSNKSQDEGEKCCHVIDK